MLALQPCHLVTMHILNMYNAVDVLDSYCVFLSVMSSVTDISIHAIYKVRRYPSLTGNQWTDMSVHVCSLKCSTAVLQANITTDDVCYLQCGN